MALSTPSTSLDSMGTASLEDLTNQAINQAEFSSPATSGSTQPFITELYTAGSYSGSSGEVKEYAQTTDVVTQPVKLYIEGIEVPYSFISISQYMGSLPVCEFGLAPMSGLMDISRYYQAKVHVFYEDRNYGGDRLLFWGHIVAASYAKSREGMASSNVSFRCRHKNSLLNQITLEFNSPVRSESMNDNNPNSSATLVPSFSSGLALSTALTGITGVRKEDKDKLASTQSKSDLAAADVSKIPPSIAEFEKRLVGIPAVIVNLWQQVKRGALMNPDINLNMLAMYIPLFEEGLGYLKRLSGHYPLENKQQQGRVDSCPNPADTTKTNKKMVPPAFRCVSNSAIQEYMTTKAVMESIQFSGELTDFAQICENFFMAIEYQTITLASPAEVAVDPEAPILDFNQLDGREACAVETVVLPQIPFYYAPLCNVVFPKMFSSINIAQDEEAIPTRVKTTHAALPVGDSQFALGANYRGPHSIREAEAHGRMTIWNNSKGPGDAPLNFDLKTTTGATSNIPGRYEQGRGQKPLRIELPWWLAMMAKGESASDGLNGESFPESGTAAEKDMILLRDEWTQMHSQYGTENEDGTATPGEAVTNALNPMAIESNIKPYERILFTSTDYQFSKLIAGARTGSIECAFNPYIIPGYPMDIIDSSPNHPSFHGLCVSVTHSITPRSMGTSISIAAAMTYAEMSNYYLPPLHPWLETALGLVTRSEDGKVNGTLINNPEAKLAADKFYQSVLGVGAADPSEMIDFANNQAIPNARNDVGTLMPSVKTRIEAPNGGDLNPWNTTMGNLLLVSRRIESKDAISSKFGYTFIDMSRENYTGTPVGYSSPKLGDNLLREPGGSLFLDYMSTVDFIKASKELIGRRDSKA